MWDRLGDMGVETRHRYNKPHYEQFVFTEHEGFNSGFTWSENDNGHGYESLSLHNVEDVLGKVISFTNQPNIEEGNVVGIVRKYC
ncbi:hypothetical protein DVK05_04700 [Halorubrum sp. Atlit-8R]|uniref:hypothetical protein n=1 Tax=unclassified Halorubrum TaxID=2642239 RepID=UPI000EF1A752|nr:MULTISPECIES: hypothetical protein [unclassified Halorubrum]RLM70756.1 hypothetical protein DVK08_01060 [Halorubrum sp. Atlit-9R]RLM71624.1 hypothetical protein DVK08_05800 [Halorubrum sp. Atlit-9R]RLM83091.1 hypothetical protein DVK05_04700 [Halorubrum sp. Atlit-8R]